MIVCERVEKRFPAAGGEVVALEDVDISVQRGDFIAIKGPSGCGKSTLLLAIGGMQRPSAGRVLFEDADIYAMSANERNKVRAERIGFVFQLFHLVPYLTVRENILMGAAPNSSSSDIRERTDALISQLGLQGRAGEKPATLSAGERQRVALARALIKEPALILADEPTGNLDPENAAEVFRHLADYQKSGGTVIVVTHGADADPHANRTITMNQGRIVSSAVSDSSNKNRPVPTQ